MKYFFILFLFVSTFLAAEENIIMMELKTKLKVPEDFRGVTEIGYSLVSEEDQIQTMKEQTKSDEGCIDDSCLVNVGKMLAVKGIVLIEIKQKTKKSYLFKAKYIDFESGTTQKIKQEYFEYELSNYKELSNFGKVLIKKMFGKSIKIDNEVKANENQNVVKNDEIVKKSEIKNNIQNEEIIISDGMVKIPNKSFKCDITEVTVLQFEKCIEVGKCSKKNYKANNFNSKCNLETNNKKHPMNCVNFYAAEEFCKWAGKRLPSKDEWEYIAKAGKNYKYSGSDNVDSVAWYKDEKTYETGKKKSNDYKVFDMSGNVWEWTNSFVESNSMKYYILRGGSFINSDEKKLQITSEMNTLPENFSSDFGFRCVKDE